MAADQRIQKTRVIYTNRMNLLVCALSSLFFFSGCRENASSTEKTPDFAVSQKGSNAVKKEELNCRWFSDETDAVVQLRIQELAKSAFFADYANISNWRDQDLTNVLFGVPGDLKMGMIEKLTFGVENSAGMVTEIVHFSDLHKLAPNMLLVIDLVDSGKNESNSWSELSKGIEFLPVSDQEFPPMAKLVVSKNTVLVGPVRMLERIRERGENPSGIARFQFADPEAQFVLALAPRDSSVVKKMELPKKASTKVRQVAKLLREHSGRCGFQVYADASFRFKFKFDCADPDVAAQINDAMESAIKDEQAIAVESEQKFALLNVINAQLLKNLQPKRSGKYVEVETSLDKVETKNLSTLAPLMALVIGLNSNAAAVNEVSTSKAYLRPQSDSDLSKGMRASLEATLVKRVNFEKPNRDLVSLRTTLEFNGDQQTRLLGMKDLKVDSITGTHGPMSLERTSANRQLMHAFLLRDDFPSGESGKQNQLQIPMSFAVDQIPLKHIQQFKGTVTLLEAAELQREVIENVWEIDKDGVQSDLLETAGLHFQVRAPDFEGDSKSIALTLKEGFIFENAGAFNSKGERLENVFPKIELLSTDQCRLTLHAVKGKLPEKIELRFDLISKVQEHRLEFEFRNVAIKNSLDIPMVKLDVPSRNESTIQGEEQAGRYVCARVDWGTVQHSDASGLKEFNPLRVTVEMSGPACSRPVAIGNVQVATGICDSRKIPLFEDQISPIRQMKRGFVFYDDLMWGSPGPIEGANLVLYFLPPNKSPNRIDELKGELTLVTGEGEKGIRIDDLHQYLGKDIPHPMLEQMNLRLKPVLAGNGISVTVEGANHFAVSELIAIDSGGGILASVYSGKQVFNGRPVHSFNTAEEFPNPMPVRIHLYSRVKEHRIPFAFQNMDIPKVESAQVESTK